jgi:hypothetical protein
MSEKKPDKSYGLDPSDDGKSPPASTSAPDETVPEQIDEGGDDQAEPDPPEESSHIKALDVCPNCASPLGGVDAVVCLRCGFDMKTLKVLQVKTGETATPDTDTDETEKGEPLCVQGVGGVGLPAAMAIVSLVLLAIGYLFGARGLFAVPVEETVGFNARVGGLLGMLVRTGGLTLAGMGGLSVLSHMLDRRFGDMQLAAVRLLGIFAALGLLTFFNLESSALEWTMESIFQAVIFVGLASVFFGLSIRDAATLMGVTVFSVIILLLGSALVLWAAGLLGQGP